MKIFVCLKPVIDEKYQKIDSKGNIIRESVTPVINKADEYAIENALVLKDRYDFKITAISMGPENSKELIKYAISKGCDDGIVISDPFLKGSDCLVTSKVLASAIKKINNESDSYLVYCGISSQDAHTSSVPAQISYFLKIPLIAGAIKSEIKEGKLLSYTQNMIISSTIPAVVSFEISCDIKPRISPLNLRIKAKSYNPEILNLKDLKTDITASMSQTYVESLIDNNISEKQTKIIDIELPQDIEKIKKILYE